MTELLDRSLNVDTDDIDTKYKLIAIKTLYSGIEGLGGLSVFEGERDIPFEIKRVYYIHGVEGKRLRGMHAHKTLRQLLFCPFGQIEVSLDDGHSKRVIRLDSPEKGLMLEPGLWREMLWSQENSVLCVAASEYYDEKDYIREYNQFRSYINLEGAISTSLIREPDGVECAEAPFEIKRVYYIHGVSKGVCRGAHAHKELVKKVFLVSGLADMRLDDGVSKSSVQLSGVGQSLVLKPSIWHEMCFEECSTVLLVLASDYYNESDYLRSYDDFLSYYRKGKSNGC